MSRQNKEEQDVGRSSQVAGACAPTREAAVVGSAANGTETAEHQPDLSASPRLRSADRQQLLSSMTIDDLLELDHPARAVWQYVEGLDLSELYDRIRARGSDPGRPAIDPRILVALWL